MNILIVDDDRINLRLFSRMLETIPDLVSIEASDPVAAMDWCREHDPDLVLVDYMMPEMDGLQFLEQFRALPGKATIPVIIATADVHTEVRHKALEMSANDFLTKPVNKIELRARVTNMLNLRRAQRVLEQRAGWLAEEVAKATKAILARERESIHRLTLATAYRDPETGAHLMRLAEYSRLIAANLGLGKEEQDLVADAAPMHDIGKVGIADNILLKPGRLTDEEMAVMRNHPQIGFDILKGSSSPLLQAAATIAYAHHEKYDGTGYPRGLRGEDIPLHARIIAVADVFDALTSPRPYKKAWDMERAAEYLRANAGTHFDPRCIDAFFKSWDAVLEIQARYRDDEEQQREQEQGCLT